MKFFYLPFVVLEVKEYKRTTFRVIHLTHTGKVGLESRKSKQAVNFNKQVQAARQCSVWIVVLPSAIPQITNNINVNTKEANLIGRIMNRYNTQKRSLTSASFVTRGTKKCYVVSNMK